LINSTASVCFIELQFLPLTDTMRSPTFKPFSSAMDLASTLKTTIDYNRAEIYILFLAYIPFSFQLIFLII